MFDLKEVVNHWFELGTHLNVPHEVLSRIDKDFTDSSRKLSEMLHYWLSNEVGPSWKKIIDALERMKDHRNLCLRLKDKYNCGEAAAALPSQLNSGNY